MTCRPRLRLFALAACLPLLASAAPARAGTMLVTELEGTYNGITPLVGDRQPLFTWTGGFVGSGTELSNYPVDNLDVNITALSSTSADVVVNPGTSRFVIYTPEEDPADRMPLVTFAIDGPGVFDPFFFGSRRGVITLPVVFSSSSFPGLEFGSLNRLELRYEGMEILPDRADDDPDGVATWGDFGPVTVTFRLFIVPEPATAPLLAAGAAALVGLAWRRRLTPAGPAPACRA